MLLFISHLFEKGRTDLLLTTTSDENEAPLASPLGEVAEQSEVGEGYGNHRQLQQLFGEFALHFTLSVSDMVTDSSPKGDPSVASVKTCARCVFAAGTDFVFP